MDGKNKKKRKEEKLHSEKSYVVLSAWNLHVETKKKQKEPCNKRWSLLAEA